MLFKDEKMKALNKSSIGKISGITISLIIIITSFIILKQTGIVKAQNEITGYETADVSSNLTDIANETSQESLILNESSENLDIILEYPQKITRGESLTARASVTNSGSSSVKNVVMMWKLTNGFEVVSGNLEERCGDLEVKNTCISEVELKTNLSTTLGINDIKIVVNYE